MLLLSGLAVLVLLVVGWQVYKYYFVQRKLAQVVAEKTKGLYILHYDQLAFDEVAGMLHVKNIDIEPDTAVYQQMVRENKDPPLLLRIQVDALDIARVKTPKALLTKELEGGKVEVTRARIRIMVQHFKKDSAVYNPTPDLTKQLLGRLLKIAIDSVEIKDASIVVGSLDSSENYFRGNNVSLLLAHFFIDSSALKDSTTLLFSRGLTLTCKELDLPSGNKKYTIGTDSLRFTSTDNTLRVAQVKIRPRLSETAFAASFPIQKDRYDFSLKDIVLHHIDRKALWQKGIRADSLVIGESAFRIYRDISRPPDTTSKVGKYPQQLLMHVPFPLSIGKIIFAHSFIEYKEKNGKSNRSGRVQFHDARASIQNVTNRREDVKNDHRCIVDFHARFLNKAPINARLDLLLKDPKGRFTIEGDIGSLDAPSLNPLTEPMALTRLERGKINHLRFAIRGTDSAGYGQVTLSYEDIKVSLLKKDEGDAGFDKKDLASFLANLVVKNSSKSGKPAMKEVDFQRILNKSFFNLIWKTLFTGIKESVGMK
ncbi:hypothetical protein [Puia sp.]|uniref:hypothetical protein n=1 Tax=Puia sp. TaxID=2045100 RepID=UPI002F427036